MKEQFVIEEEGQEEVLSEENEQNLLQRFVQFIIKSKVVILEDLASEFKLKTQVNSFEFFFWNKNKLFVSS